LLKSADVPVPENMQGRACLEKMRVTRDTGVAPESKFRDIAGEGTLYNAVQAGTFPYEESCSGRSRPRLATRP
jgi:hypothetical protein